MFSTRPDTIFGASFAAIAPDHPISTALAANDPALVQFIEDCRATGTAAAEIETAEKKGFDTGLRVNHPLKPGATLPVFVANFVLMDYGTGAVMAVPAHDQRDLEFARKYMLPVTRVVAAAGEEQAPIGDEAYAGPGRLVASDFLDGLGVEAKAAVIARAEAEGWGTGTTVWRLRDWGVSRQRCWGTPIPVIHCEACGVVPVPREQLPVMLPEDVTFDVPGNPLDRHPTWKHVSCPSCGGPAVRETDTLDTFADSSWYFIRFASAPKDRPFDRTVAEQWLPVGQYTRRRGACDPPPPLCALLDAGAGAGRHDRPRRGLCRPLHARHGHARDLQGPGRPLAGPGRSARRLCPGHGRAGDDRARREDVKSKKNTVDPGPIVEQYGADAVRWFMLSDSPPERDLPWSKSGIEERMALRPALVAADSRLSAHLRGARYRRWTCKLQRTIAGRLRGH